MGRTAGARCSLFSKTTTTPKKDNPVDSWPQKCRGKGLGTSKVGIMNIGLESACLGSEGSPSRGREKKGLSNELVADASDEGSKLPFRFGFKAPRAW